MWPPVLVFGPPLAAKSWKRACHTPVTYLLNISLASCHLKNGFRRFVRHIICNNNQSSTPEKENAHHHSLQSFALIPLDVWFLPARWQNQACKIRERSHYCSWHWIPKYPYVDSLCLTVAQPWQINVPSIVLILFSADNNTSSAD